MSCKSCSEGKTQLAVKTWQSSFVTNVGNRDGLRTQLRYLDLIVNFQKLILQNCTLCFSG